MGDLGVQIETELANIDWNDLPLIANKDWRAKVMDALFICDRLDVLRKMETKALERPEKPMWWCLETAYADWQRGLWEECDLSDRYHSCCSYGIKGFAVRAAHMWHPFTMQYATDQIHDFAQGGYNDGVPMFQRLYDPKVRKAIGASVIAQAEAARLVRENQTGYHAFAFKSHEKDLLMFAHDADESELANIKKILAANQDYPLFRKMKERLKYREPDDVMNWQASGSEKRIIHLIQQESPQPKTMAKRDETLVSEIEYCKVGVGGYILHRDEAEIKIKAELEKNPGLTRDWLLNCVGNEGSWDSRWAWQKGLWKPLEIMPSAACYAFVQDNLWHFMLCDSKDGKMQIVNHSIDSKQLIAVPEALRLAKEEHWEFEENAMIFATEGGIDILLFMLPATPKDESCIESILDADGEKAFGDYVKGKKRESYLYFDGHDWVHYRDNNPPQYRFLKKRRCLLLAIEELRSALLYCREGQKIKKNWNEKEENHMIREFERFIEYIGRFLDRDNTISDLLITTKEKDSLLVKASNFLLVAFEPEIKFHLNCFVDWIASIKPDLGIDDLPEPPNLASQNRKSQLATIKTRMLGILYNINTCKKEVIGDDVFSWCQNVLLTNHDLAKSLFSEILADLDSAARKALALEQWVAGMDCETPAAAAKQTELQDCSEIAECL